MIDHRNKVNEEFISCMIELDMFSRLGSNTYIRYDRTIQNDRITGFVPTGGVYSSIPLVQTSVTMWHAHSFSDIITQFEKFCEKIKNCAQNILQEGLYTPDTSLRRRKYNEIQLLHSAVESALGGCEESGGLYGLLPTYSEETIAKQLVNAISQMKHAVINVKHQADSWYFETLSQFGFLLEEPLPYCPEKYFSQIEWEQALSISKGLKIESPSLYKYYGNFCTALNFNLGKNLLSNWNPWDEIIEVKGQIGAASLFLGVLPLKIESIKRNDAADLEAIGIQAVLSVVEVFENHSLGNVISPIISKDWDQLGIKHLQLPSLDFETISFEMIQRGVEFIRWNLENGRSIYVHCKAGRGRSALIVMCYLIQYQQFTSDEAMAHVTSQRMQVSLDEKSSKYDTLISFEKKLKAQKENPLITPAKNSLI